VTTTVVLQGRGEAGEGEDVTYDAAAHDGFPEPDLVGSYRFWEYSRLLDEELVGAGGDPDHRRWAFESAAFDLALRQAGLSLASALGREARPVRFVVSTRRGIDEWLALYPGLELKLDAEPAWDGPAMARLAATGAVPVVDLKAYYTGDFAQFPREPEPYRLVATAFPEAVLEDAWLGDGCREALAADDRLSFDAPVHRLADLDGLPLEPRWLNVKPSRFGRVKELLDTIAACERRGIRMYGGGQFELGPGRRQIQTLASVLYADGPNDVAPSDYNEGAPRAGLPASPLPSLEHIGF
jgi:hypothetical protein